MEIPILSMELLHSCTRSPQAPETPNQPPSHSFTDAKCTGHEITNYKHTKYMVALSGRLYEGMKIGPIV